MRTTIIISLLVLAFAASLQAQGPRFTGYGIDLFPHITDRRLVAFGPLALGLVDSLEANETSRLSYGLGVFLSYRGEKIGIRFGLNYLREGYDGKRTEIPFTDPYASEFSEVEYSFLSQQLEVPFSILFYQQLSDKDEFFFLLGSGVSFNMKNTDIYTRYEGSVSEIEKIDAPHDFRALNVSIETGMGWEHKFGHQFAMSIAPTFKLWLGGLYKDEVLNRNLYQFGLKVAFKIDREIEYID